ncbi:unnamed protein product [Cuscuta campestris]|uniref:Uncharacterized protein n=1 Tax=Cuscuta campestris TaxID=132261 RepID=A0A484N0A2_9ASTE|nr:unnamed protein product [Cuscuta campestris]
MARFAFVCGVILGMLVVGAMADGASWAAYPRKLLQGNTGEMGSIADPPLPGGPGSESGEEEAEAPESVATHHHSDKSVAGGEVIIGGLVTALFAAVYCYIRVTRRRVEGDQRSVY